MQTLQYSLIHRSGTARPNGEDAIVLTVLMLFFTEAVPQDQLFIYPRSVTQRSWKRREGVVRRSCISIIIP